MAPLSDPLEQLLEKLASDEVPYDVRHHYALRRALLNSTQFESNASAQAVWGQWMAMTGTVLAGSAAMAVFVVSVKISDMSAIRNAAQHTAVAERQVQTSSTPRISLASMPHDAPMQRLWSSFQTQMLAVSR
jgi:hypothetical protein